MSKNTPVDIYGKEYHRGLLIAILLIGTFCTVLNQTLLTTAFPTLMETFGVTASDVQWLTTGFLLVNGIMIPISATLVNKFASRNLYLFSMITFLIGTIVCYIAPSFSALLIGRLIQAAGVGLSMPLLQTVILFVYPPEKRGAAMGIVGIVIGLAPALGPTLSGWIIDNYEWRLLFGMVIPIVAIAIVMAFFFMKSVIPLTNPKIDVLSTILSSIGFGGLLYGFSSVGKEGWGSPVVISTLVIGVVSLVLFALRQLKMEEPFLNIRVFKSTGFSVSAILSGVTNMALIGAEMVVPLYIQNIRGTSAFQSGLMLLPGAIVMGLMMPVTGRIFDKKGARKLVTTGMFILTAATLPFAFLTATTPISLIMVLYAIRMFGISMVMMPVTTSGMNTLPTELLTHGSAAINTFRQVASSIGTAVLISVLSNVTANNMPSESVLAESPLVFKEQAVNATLTGYHAAFYVAIAFSAIGFVVAFLLKDKKEVLSFEKGGN